MLKDLGKVGSHAWNHIGFQATGNFTTHVAVRSAAAFHSRVSSQFKVTSDRKTLSSTMAFPALVRPEGAVLHLSLGMKLQLESVLRCLESTTPPRVACGVQARAQVAKLKKIRWKLIHNTVVSRKSPSAWELIKKMSLVKTLRL